LSKRHYLFLGLFFCLMAALPAWGRKEKSEAKKNDSLEISAGENASKNIDAAKTDEIISTFVQATGVVRLVGSGLFPETVITGPDREWYISKEDEHLLIELQHRTVTVEGYESVFELRFANGLSAGLRRTLKDIKIIGVE